MSARKGGRFGANPRRSDHAGVTPIDKQVGCVVTRLAEGKPNVTVRQFPSMISVDGEDTIGFDYADIPDAAA
jgi:propane monooxygenase coupling protein